MLIRHLKLMLNFFAPCLGEEGSTFDLAQIKII